jgi:phosphoglucosamine mutase
MRELFGTDGIRGTAGQYPLDRPTTFAIGVALAQWIGTNHLNPEVVIGMDTRESGSWIAEHVAGGLAQGGVRARHAGLISTPGLAFVAKTGPFAAGIMISASHNPYQDNGVKIFDHSGFKLPDQQEHVLEGHIFGWTQLGKAFTPQPLAVDESLDRTYIEHLAGTLPEGLAGMRIVADTANGAASYLAPAMFERLGAEVDCIHNTPDGKNINLNCGALHVEALQKRVVERGATLGVAFDGDADRAMFVSPSGKIVDGDGVLLLAARWLQAKRGLTEVVSTVMSNLGLERALARHGIGMVRTPVGDKYVLEEMIRREALLGGEQSGHIIFREYATTGDGLLTALRVCEVMRASGRSLEDMASVKDEIRRMETEFGDAGRVVVRFSGTEPLARVMVEGPKLDRVQYFAESIAAAIRSELG